MFSLRIRGNVYSKLTCLSKAESDTVISLYKLLPLPQKANDEAPFFTLAYQCLFFVFSTQF